MRLALAIYAIADCIIFGLYLNGDVSQQFCYVGSLIILGIMLASFIVSIIYNKNNG